MEAIMSNTTRMMMGVAVAMAIVTVSAVRWTGAVEQTPVEGPQILVNRDAAVDSEAGGGREQLRRYFLEDRRFQLSR
jgi:hypothetical protein